jgi:hypothetical protein
MNNHWSKEIGFVVSGNDRDDPNIEVFCPEFLPLAEGELTDEQVDVQVTVEGTDEIPQSPKNIKTSMTIKCEYIGNGEGVSIPDMVPGEQVLVHKMLGDDRYFWTPYRYRNVRRMFEHRKFEIMTKKHNGEPTSEDETYSIEFDSSADGNIRGIRIHTGDGRDEAFKYTFYIDTGSGKVTLKDDAGNFIELRSGSKQIEMQNSSKSYVLIDDKDIKVRAPQDISVDGGRHVDVKAQQNVTLHALQNLSLKADGTAECSCGGAMYWKSSGIYTIEAPTIVLNTNNLKVTGNVDIGKNLNVRGYSTSNGGTGFGD